VLSLSCRTHSGGVKANSLEMNPAPNRFPFREKALLGQHYSNYV